MTSVFDDVVAAIGHTPMVRLNRIARDCGATIYAKLEFLNPVSHYRTTGPEIWEQLGDAIDAVVIATGTGGTLTGIGKYLKEKKPSIRMVLIDPVGSILYDYFKTRTITKSFKTYKAEGFG